MSHSAIEKTIEFAGRQRLSPLSQIPVIQRFARIGLLKRVLVHLKRVHLSRQNAPFLLLLLVELAMTLFVAGIAVPSFLQSGVDAKEALVRGSLHSINVAGIAFSFTYENLGCAMLGMLTGAAAAFLIVYPVTTPDGATSKEHRATRVQDGEFSIAGQCALAHNSINQFH